jgi:hypothetical protein
MSVLFDSTIKTRNRIKVSNCGYIHLISMISEFYRIYLVDSIIISQLDIGTFAHGHGDDLIYGIHFNDYQIRISHICTSGALSYCATDEIELGIFTTVKSKHVQLTSTFDIPPVVLSIYEHLVRFMNDQN